MRCVVLAESLQRKLSFVSHGTSSKNQLPILSHVLLETIENQIRLRTTDLELGIETVIDAQVEETGAITVLIKPFLELVNNLRQEKVTLFLEGSSLHIVSSKLQATLPVSQANEFPLLYEEKGEEVFRMSGSEFKKRFGRIVFATSSETTRPALSGVFIKGIDNKMILVATDGYRLSLDAIEKENISSHSPLIIPAKLIREAFFFKEEGDITLFLLFQKKQIIFTQGNDVIVGRQIEAEFPNYERILPSDLTTKILLDREELQRAVKTSDIFAREAANVIVFSIQKDKILVSAKKSSIGENTVEVEAQVKGEENEIAFNAKYLLEFLGNFTEEQVSFEMSGPLNPAIFSSPQTSSFLHLIMPIRTEE